MLLCLYLMTLLSLKRKAAKSEHQQHKDNVEEMSKSKMAIKSLSQEIHPMFIELRCSGSVSPVVLPVARESVPRGNSWSSWWFFPLLNFSGSSLNLKFAVALMQTPNPMEAHKTHSSEGLWLCKNEWKHGPHELPMLPLWYSVSRSLLVIWTSVIKAKAVNLRNEVMAFCLHAFTTSTFSLFYSQFF